MRPAIALLELHSIARGIEAGDAMAKRAPVDVLRAGTVHPGRFLVLVGGATADVEEALDAGRAVGLATPRRGLLSSPARALRQVLREVVARAAARQPGVHLAPEVAAELGAEAEVGDDPERPSRTGAEVGLAPAAPADEAARVARRAEGGAAART